MLPFEDYIYYADTANVPYGIKTREQVRGFVMEAGSVIAEMGVKALVIACNTATSAAVAEIRNKYSFPVIGMEPAIKPALEKEAEKRILVLATTLTLKEELENLISRFDGKSRLDRLPMDGLVGFAERFEFKGMGVASYIKDALSGIDIENYGCVVLGCTHFIYFHNIIKSYFLPGTKFIDGNQGTVNHIKKVLEKNGLLKLQGPGSIEFYNSGKPESDPEAGNIQEDH